MKKNMILVIAAAAALGGAAGETAVAAEQEAASEGAREVRLFELRTYYAPPGRLDDLNARFRNHTLKLFAKHGMINIGYWVPVDNPDHKLIYLLAYPNRDAREASWKAFLADSDWQEAKKKTEAQGPIVAKIESLLLKPTDYSPLVVPKAAGERAFELRTYTASPGNLDNLNARFRDHTVKLFEKHGITNIGYWVPAEGQPGAENTLVYLLAHRSVEGAKQSFDVFRQDPDWLAARKASEDKAGGSLTVADGVKSVFLKPTDYSPMK